MTKIISFIILLLFVSGQTSFAENNNNDVGVTDIIQPVDGQLTATETIEISIFNFGTVAQSNFDVTYQINGGTVITESFTSTIAPGTSETFIFTSTADLSIPGQNYIIEASTMLTGDDDATNDSFTKVVKHLHENDIGVSAILSPVSGANLQSNETVTIEITNFGWESQSNFNVSYTINALPVVTETVTATLPAGTSINYTFAQTADLSSLGNYTFTATTLLTGDANPANDGITKTISHTPCQAMSDCSDNDGLTKFILQEINLPYISCNGYGYYNYTHYSATLDAQVGNYFAVIQTGFGNNIFSGWIDLNDNGIFEPSEQIFNSIPVSSSNTDVNVPITIPSNALNGDHILRIRGKWAPGTGNLNDPCDDLEYGKTVDFIIHVVNGTLSIANPIKETSEFIVLNKGNKQYELLITSAGAISEASFNVYSISGQQLVSGKMETGSGNYFKSLDMSPYSSGVYIVTVTAGNFKKVQRIVVK